MSKKQFLKSALLGGLVIGTLVFGSFKANATGFNENAAHDNKSISSIKFCNVIKNISLNQAANDLSKPSVTIVMKNVIGM